MADRTGLDARRRLDRDRANDPARILDHESDLSDEPFSSMVTLNISKKLMRQILTLSNMLYCDLNDGEIFDRVKADYEIRDGIHLLVGADFCGDDGQFGRYKDSNSQVWVRLKYGF